MLIEKKMSWFAEKTIFGLYLKYTLGIGHCRQKKH